MAPIGRANLPESVAGAFEFPNERTNNPFLDDADSNNIYLSFLPSTSETPARFRFVVGSREVASCCTVYIRSFQKSSPFSRSLRYLYTSVCACTYIHYIHAHTITRCCPALRWIAKREWPAHSLGIGLVSSFNFRPLHKPSPMVRSRRERNRRRDVEKRFLGRLVRAWRGSFTRPDPSTWSEHLPSP